MQPPSVTLKKNRFLIFLVSLALAVIVLGAIATSKYGAGMAGDSIKYVAVAQKILEGAGLADHRGLPLVVWPPLYPMLIALLGWLTGWDVFVAAWYFNVFLLGANLFLSGVIFQRIFFAKPLYAYLASLFVFLSISALKIHAIISSDPFYLTLTLLFLLAMTSYVETKSYRAFAWMVLLGMLAALQRYVGLVLPVSALVIVAIENRKSIRILIRDGLVLAALSVLPIAWWLLIHNLGMNGSLWGMNAITNVGENVTLAFTKMLHWFVPYLSFLMPVLTRPWIPLGLLMLLIVWLNRKQRISDILRSKQDEIRLSYPTLMHAFVYFAAVALSSSTPDHRYLYSDRYYVILLVPVVILVVFVFDWFVRPNLKFSFLQVDWALIIFFLVWSFYPLYSLREYLMDSVNHGEASDYNLFNTQAYHENDIVLEAQKLTKVEPNAILYSNFVDVIWFYTRKDAFILPSAYVANPNQVYAGWPYNKNGAYIFWFEPYEFGFDLPPNQIAKFADLHVIFRSSQGKIYFAQAQQL